MSATMTVNLRAAQQVFVLGALLPDNAVRIEQSPLSPEKCSLHVYTARLHDRYEVKKTLQALIAARFAGTGWEGFMQPQPEPFPADVPAQVFASMPIPLPGIGGLPVLFELQVTEVILDVAPAP